MKKVTFELKVNFEILTFSFFFFGVPLGSPFSSGFPKKMTSLFSVV